MTPEQARRLLELKRRYKAGDSLDASEQRELLELSRAYKARGAVDGGVALSSPPSETEPEPGSVYGQAGIPARDALGRTFGPAGPLPPGARVVGNAVPGMPPGAVEVETPQGPAYFTPEGTRLFTDVEVDELRRGAQQGATVSNLEGVVSGASGAGLNLTVPLARALGGKAMEGSARQAISNAPVANLAGGLASAAAAPLLGGAGLAAGASRAVTSLASRVPLAGGLVAPASRAAATPAGQSLGRLGVNVAAGAVDGAARNPDDALSGALLGGGGALVAGGAVEGLGWGASKLGQWAAREAPERAMNAATSAGIKKPFASYGFETPQDVTEAGRFILDNDVLRPFEPTVAPALERMRNVQRTAGARMDAPEAALRRQASFAATGTPFDSRAAQKAGEDAMWRFSGLPPGSQGQMALPSPAATAQATLKEVANNAFSAGGPGFGPRGGIAPADSWQAAKAGLKRFRETHSPGADVVGAKGYLINAEEGFGRSYTQQAAKALDDYAAQTSTPSLAPEYSAARRDYSLSTRLGDMLEEEAGRATARKPGLGDWAMGSTAGAGLGTALGGPEGALVGAAAGYPLALGYQALRARLNPATLAWGLNRGGQAAAALDRLGAVGGGAVGAVPPALAARGVALAASEPLPWTPPEDTRPLEGPLETPEQRKRRAAAAFKAGNGGGL
ncbi:MAG: hypothetical protein SFW67_35530 [Myxococcaceae bacterium]|nr:hypothetical protein [Myxococcaceae bacterium]